MHRSKCQNVCKCHITIDTGFKQTERTVFLRVISIGLKSHLLSNVYFKKWCPNCQKILEIITHKTLTRTRTNIAVRSWILVFTEPQSQEPISRSGLEFWFSEPQHSNKCWSKLPLKCHIFPISMRRYKIYQHDHPIHALYIVGLLNQVPCVGMIMLSNDIIIVPAYLRYSI